MGAKISKAQGPTNTESVDPVTGEVTDEAAAGLGNLDNERRQRAEVALTNEHDQLVVDGEDAESARARQAAAAAEAVRDAEDATGKTYEEHTVEELREELRGRDLTVGGNKDELVSRLVADDKTRADKRADDKGKPSPGTSFSPSSATPAPTAATNSPATPTPAPAAGNRSTSAPQANSTAGSTAGPASKTS